MKFQDIPSNSRVKHQLIQAVNNNRLGHAHLFCSEDGMAGLPISLAFTQYLFCEQKTENDSCGECSSCIKSDKLIHPDTHFIFPVTTGKNTKPISDHYIQEWRKGVIENPFLSETDWYSILGVENKQGFISVNEAQELSKKTVLKTYENSYRVIIIWHAEKLLAAASNKLLKLIEEPPEKTVFFLLTPSPESLLDTINSRVQSTIIDKCDENTLSQFLVDKFSIELNKANDISRLTSGNIGNAIRIIKGNEQLSQNTNEFQNWMRLCYKAKVIELSNWVDLINRWGREQQKGFIHYALHMIRESLIQNYADSDIQKLRDEEIGFTKNFSPFIHQNNVIEIIEELELAHQHISRNGNTKFIFMDLSLKLVVLLHVKNLTLQ
ncbi:MAG: ATP-binding protein [Flavobacteriales bacterium]